MSSVPLLSSLSSSSHPVILPSCSSPLLSPFSLPSSPSASLWTHSHPHHPQHNTHTHTQAHRQTAPPQAQHTPPFIRHPCLIIIILDISLSSTRLHLLSPPPAGLIHLSPKCGRILTRTIPRPPPSLLPPRAHPSHRHPVPLLPCHPRPSPRTSRQDLPTPSAQRATRIRLTTASLYRCSSLCP